MSLNDSLSDMSDLGAGFEAATHKVMEKRTNLNGKTFFKRRVLPQVERDWTFKGTVAIAFEGQDILLVATAFTGAADA